MAASTGANPLLLGRGRPSNQRRKTAREDGKMIETTLLWRKTEDENPEMERLDDLCVESSECLVIWPNEDMGMACRIHFDDHEEPHWRMQGLDGCYNEEADCDPKWWAYPVRPVEQMIADTKAEAAE